MFKSLKDRLKGVSQRLEDELEAKFEAELEAELAAEMARAAPEPERPVPEPEPSPEPEPHPQPPRPEPEPDPEPAPEPGPPLPEPDPQPPVPEPPRPPGPSPTPPEPMPTPEPGPGVSQGQPPAPAGVASQPAKAPATSTSPGSAPSPATTAPHASAHASAKASPVGPAPSTTATPGATPAPHAPKAASEHAAAQAKPQPPVRITGRKMLTEQEIEERLRKELEAAVEIQKEVETVARESGARVARYTISEEALDEILWDLELGLLESDVALPVIEAIKDNVREQLLSMSVAGKSAHDVVEKVLKSAVRRVLNVGHFDFDAFVDEKLKAGKRPVVVMFVGVNGTGKTTSIGRIAWRLKQRGISPVLAAGDTFRAGAIEQLTQHADRLGVKVVKHSAGADPAAVAYDAIEHAKARGKDVVLLDTAGRMQTNTNLMDEMDKIRRVANPDLVVFVGDSLAGNDAVEQARKFDAVVDIDGAILTKVDVDAKGGAALSVAYTINKPLLFVGVGQDYPDLRPFDSAWMVDRLFGAENETEAEVSA